MRDLLGLVTFTKIVRGCACWALKIWLPLYQFFAQFYPQFYPPVTIPVSIEKHPVLPKLCAFYNIICSKDTHFFKKLQAPSSLWWKPTTVSEIHKTSALCFCFFVFFFNLGVTFPAKKKKKNHKVHIRYIRYIVESSVWWVWVCVLRGGGGFMFRVVWVAFVV